MLILASRSPRRQELLRAAGIRFRIVPAEEELPLARLSGRPADLVRRSALAKARAVAQSTRGIVLGADTVVVCDSTIMGKPVSVAEARHMLRQLSGRWHRVYTGLALVHHSRHLADYECTRVAFRTLSNTEIERYLATREPFDKAGAYAIQGHGAALIRAVRGCYTNVIGLPLPKLLAMLAAFHALPPESAAP